MTKVCCSWYNRGIGGCSSTAERRPVEAEVAGSIPVSHPRVRLGTPENDEGSRSTRPSHIYYCMSETSDVSLLQARFYVYILCSFKDKGFYIGFTNNLKTRLTQHAKGQVDSTKLRLPVRLIHYEYFINEHDAKAREEFLKSGYGRRQFQQILKNTLKNLK